jgi:hypothetical protein
LLLGFGDECLNYFHRYVAIECLSRKTSRGIPEKYLGGYDGFPEPLSVQAKTRESVLAILD